MSTPRILLRRLHTTRLLLAEEGPSRRPAWRNKRGQDRDTDHRRLFDGPRLTEDMEETLVYQPPSEAFLLHNELLAHWPAIPVGDEGKRAVLRRASEERKKAEWAERVKNMRASQYWNTEKEGEFLEEPPKDWDGWKKEMGGRYEIGSGVQSVVRRNGSWEGREEDAIKVWERRAPQVLQEGKE